MHNMEKIEEPDNFDQCHFHTKIRFLDLSNFTSIMIFSLCLILAVSFFNVYPGSIRYAFSNQQHDHTELVVAKNTTREKCNLFKGQWIPDARGPMYTNNSCASIPADRNCLGYGRMDTEFLNYRWKPDECELPSFDPEAFLTIVQGKTMAFIGDSLARNQMNSLLCLLSLAETPTLVYKDAEERVWTWKFTKHNLVLKVLWSPFLVQTEGSSDLHLDKLDTWYEVLPSIDYVIINVGYWYFLHNYLYENGSLIGCNYCGAPDVAVLGPDVALRKTFRTVLKGINDCKTCKNDLHVVAVTENTAHYGYGYWDTGGKCNRTKMYRWEEVTDWGDMVYRDLLVEEVETARNVGKENVSFDIIDITGMMIVRSDAHPNENHGNYAPSGIRDCVHWCLPGPIDTWNQLLLEMLIR